jgi:hypothetical protein
VYLFVATHRDENEAEVNYADRIEGCNVFVNSTHSPGNSPDETCKTNGQSEEQRLPQAHLVVLLEPKCDVCGGMTLADRRH